MIEEVDFLLSNKTQNKYPYIQLRDLLVQYFRKAVTEKSNIIGDEVFRDFYCRGRARLRDYSQLENR